MESLVAASVFTAGPGLVHVVGGVLSVLALAATAVVVAGTATERESRMLSSGRPLCVAFCGLLAAAGFLGLFTRWELAVACVAFLLAVLAVALRFGQGTSLRDYLDALGGEEDPAWWAAFERGFRRYTSTPRREQNPLRHAVTRPRSQSVVPNAESTARRSVDVIARWRP
jgi:lysylphosphatidylglycerol synthetase-like protein (DUF2156 family)